MLDSTKILSSIILTLIASTMFIAFSIATAFPSDAASFCVSGICFLNSPTTEQTAARNTTMQEVNQTAGAGTLGTLSPQQLLDLKPWGGKDNHLGISTTNSSSGAAVYRMKGTTGNLSTGFVSQDLNFKGKNVLLTTGHAAKGSNNTKDNDFQISFEFILVGSDGRNHKLIFVHGPLYTTRGWHGNDYYDIIDSNSSRMINLGDSLLKNIIVIMQKQSKVNPIEFGVSFNG